MNIRLLTSLAVASATALTAQAAVVTTYTDTFTGTIDSRTTDIDGNVNSFEWYSRDGAWSYSSGLLVSASNERAGVGYFTDSNSAVSLNNLGDNITLTINFEFTESGNQTGQDRFRFALLGSGAEENPITANWSGDHANALTADHTGIIGTFGQLRSSTGGGSVNADNIRLYDRDSGSTLVMGNNDPLGNHYTALATGGAAYTYPSLALGTTLTATLSITLKGHTETASIVDISVIYSQGETTFSSLSITDIETESSSFDSVGIFRRTPALAIQDITITHTAVPEPSTYAAMLGLLGLGFAIWRSRKAA